MKPKKLLASVIACLVLTALLLALTWGCAGQPSATSPATSSPPPSSSASPSPSKTASPSPSATASPSPSKTASPAPTQALITLKAIRPFPYNNPLSSTYKTLIERVNKEMAGRLSITDVGGPEVYPSAEQLAPIVEGTIDILNTPASYVLGTFPEGEANYLSFGATPAEKRNGGLIDALDKMGRKKGIAVIGAPSHYFFHIYTIRPITKLDDLKQMKLRVSPTYLPVMKGLGVPTVTMPAGEVFTALQSGVVDGVAWSNFGMMDYGWHEIVRYQLYPPLWSIGDHLLFMNAKKLDSLPADVKADFLKIVQEIDAQTPDIFNAFAADETAKLRQAGVKAMTVSDEEWRTVQELQWNEALKVLNQIAPDNYVELKQIVTQWYPPKNVFTTPYEWK